MFYRIIEFLKKSPLTYNVLVAISSAINFITLIVFGRIFSVDDYGMISTLQVAVTNLGNMIMPIQIIVCRSIAENTTSRKDINNIISLFIIVNALHVIMLTLFWKLFLGYLHIENIGDYALFVLLLIGNNTFIFLNGVLQGKQLFVKLGLCSIFFYLLKLLAALALGLSGAGYLAVIVGMLFSEVVCIIYMIVIIDDNIEWLKNFHFEIVKERLPYFFWTMLLYVIVSIYINNGDLLLGNVYCSKNDIGLYSVSANLAKISFFLIATPIATVIMPKIAQQYNNKKRQLNILIKAEVMVFLISLIYAILFILFGRILIETLYGKEYLASAGYLFQCAVFSVTLGGFWLFYQYAVVTSLIKPFSVITAIGGIILVIGIMLYKPQIGLIPIVMSITMVLASLVSVIYQKATKS